jgi:hypothetical protein
MTREHYYEILNEMIEQLGANEILETLVEVLEINELQDLVEGLDTELFEGRYTKMEEEEDDDEWLWDPEDEVGE